MFAPWWLTFTGAPIILTRAWIAPGIHLPQHLQQHGPLSRQIFMPPVILMTAVHAAAGHAAAAACVLPKARRVRTVLVKVLCPASMSSGAKAVNDIPVCLARTLLYGGVAMNPRSHLRLVYEANPLSYIAEQVSIAERRLSCVASLSKAFTSCLMDYWQPFRIQPNCGVMLRWQTTAGNLGLMCMLAGRRERVRWEETYSGYTAREAASEAAAVPW